MLMYIHAVSLIPSVCVQLKDLKRQLAHMQKREEKRQEQLAELTGAPGKNCLLCVCVCMQQPLLQHSLWSLVY